ncbi:MAG TPA: lamin tail domain-containing protein [Gemmatimonadales bacterium]|nr:lamin tail domain-containing protein [Gemmatimonadales bacterium]
MRRPGVMPLVLCGLAACTFEPAGGAGNLLDAAHADGRADADSEPDGPAHLLLSEIKSGPNDLEFIEIFNPTCAEVDLSTYYLTDEPTYGLLPGWGSPAPPPGFANAVVRFPAGASLPSGAAAVVARNGVEFETAFGVPAHFALVETGSSTAMLFIAYHPSQDMIIANAGDPVILFEWDAEQDLVRDVDIAIAGPAPTADRELQPKHELAPSGVDGPDTDDVATLYRSDSVAIPAMLAQDAEGSYERIAFEGGFEAASGGNGAEGHDETSEDTRNTWEQEPDTTPTPGAVPASLAVSCVGP